jgi:hypothetical protein
MTKSSKSGVGESSQEYFSTKEAMDDIGIKKTAFFKYRQLAGIQSKIGPGGRVRYTRQEVDTIREAFEVEKWGGNQDICSADSARTTKKDSADSQDRVRKTPENQGEETQKSPDGGWGSSLERELREQIAHFKKEAQEKGAEIRILNERLIKTAGDFGKIETQNQFLLVENKKLRENMNDDQPFDNRVYGNGDTRKSRFTQTHVVRDAEFTNIPDEAPETENSPIEQGRGAKLESKAAQKKNPQHQKVVKKARKKKKEEKEKRKNEEEVIHLEINYAKPAMPKRWWAIWQKKAA